MKLSLIIRMRCVNVVTSFLKECLDLDLALIFISLLLATTSYVLNMSNSQPYLGEL